ncbi:MAG: hypothetical protein WDA03_10170, partial [Trueperaceae bacterium]
PRFTISPTPIVIEAGMVGHIAVYDNGELVRWPAEVTAQAVQGPLFLGKSFGATTVRPSYFAEPQAAEYTVTVNSDGEYTTVRGQVQIINRQDSVTVSSGGLTRDGDEGRLGLIVSRSGNVDNPLTLSLAPVQGLQMATEVQIPASYRNYVTSIPVEFRAGFAEGVELMYEATAEGSSTSGSITLSSVATTAPFDNQYLATLVVNGEGLVSFAVTDARLPGEGQVGTTAYELPAHISEYHDWAVERSVHEVEARSVEVSLVQDGHSCTERSNETNEFGKQNWIWSCRLGQ